MAKKKKLNIDDVVDVKPTWCSICKGNCPNVNRKNSIINNFEAVICTETYTVLRYVKKQEADELIEIQIAQINEQYEANTKK